MHSWRDPTTPDLRTWRFRKIIILTVTLIADTDLSVELVVHHPLEAPGSVAAGGGGQAVLLDVDGEDRVLGLGQLALVVVSAGGEEDTQAGLEVDGFTGGVLPAGLNAVVEDESSWLAVQHVGRGRVDKPRDDLEGDKV